MSTKIITYISFDTNAREAFTFYQTVFGGKLEMNTFGDFQADSDPTKQDQIMHAMLTLDSGESIMGGDTPSMMEAFKGHCGFSVTLAGENGEEIRSWFEKLSDNGAVHVSLEKQVWGDEFGMVTDKFGVNWMVNIHTPSA